MDIKVDNVYVMKDNYYLSDADSSLLIGKGHKVRVLKLYEGKNSALVLDLENDVVTDGMWIIPVSYLEAQEEQKVEPKQDNNYDQHYQGKVEPIELMQAQMTQVELIGFLKGNIIKYATRCGKKDDPAKEVTKIKRYTEWLLDVLEGRTIDPRS